MKLGPYVLPLYIKLAVLVTGIATKPCLVCDDADKYRITIKNVDVSINHEITVMLVSTFIKTDTRILYRFILTVSTFIGY